MPRHYCLQSKRFSGYPNQPACYIRHAVGTHELQLYGIDGQNHRSPCRKQELVVAATMPPPTVSHKLLHDDRNRFISAYGYATVPSAKPNTGRDREWLSPQEQTGMPVRSTTPCDTTAHTTQRRPGHNLCRGAFLTFSPSFLPRMPAPPCATPGINHLVSTAQLLCWFPCRFRSCNLQLFRRRCACTSRPWRFVAI